MKHICLLTCLLIFSLSIVSGQIMPCGSGVDFSKLSSEQLKNYQNLENFTEEFIKNNESSGTSEKLINKNGIIIVPVVVHVLNLGEPIGTGSNISDAQILSQIDVLNEDFQRINPDQVNTPAEFLPVAANTKFQFQLACLDPSGKPTNGIVRKKVKSIEFCNEIYPMMDIHGGDDAWSTSTYLNIWTCDIAKCLKYAGYTQPLVNVMENPTLDGVLVQFSAFGRVGNLLPDHNKGRTTTHEVGHWMNLRHIWGNEQSCGQSEIYDDGVTDTPNTFAPYGSNCPNHPSSINACSEGAHDMFMNYMDYTSDVCKNIFTIGQSERMRALFSEGGYRNTIVNNLLRINNDKVCMNYSEYVTINNPLCLSVTWSISGPATITNTNNNNAKIITLTGPGLVTLTVTSGNYTDSRAFTGNYYTEVATNLGATFLPEGIVSVHFTPVSNQNAYYSMEFQTYNTDGSLAGGGTTQICYSPISSYCNTIYYISSGKSFKYRLSVIDNCGNAQYSAWSGILSPPSCLAPPTNLSVVSTCNYPGIYCGYGTFSWNPVPNAVQYEGVWMVRKMDGSASPIYTGSFLTTNVNSSQQTGYYTASEGPWVISFKVRSKCLDGSWTPFSNMSNSVQW